MKKWLILFLFLIFGSPVLAQNMGGGLNNGGGAFVVSGAGGTNGSAQYNNNGVLGGITFGAAQGISGIVQQLFQASNLLFQITQGMEIDPRFYGAACNTQFFVGNGFYNGGFNALHTTSGSPVISITGYTFVNALPGSGGDVGKQISLTCGDDLGPTTYIASVDTNANTATLGENMAFTCGAGINTVVVMGGYPTDFATPSKAADDTVYIHNASAFSAIYHGGKVVLPPRCLVHNLQLQANTWLDGNNGGNNYGSLAGPTVGAGFGINTASVTPLFAGFTGFGDDVDRVSGAASNEAISIDNPASNVRLSNFTLFCPDFPYLGFSGMSSAGIGNLSATDINSEHVVMDHITVMLCPVAVGNPFLYNQTITFTGSISGTTMTVTAITSNAAHTYDPRFPDSLAVGRAVTGAGVTANTVITAAPVGGGTGTYTVSQSSSVGSETLTSAPPVNYATSGQSRNSEYTQNGIAFNGALSDFSSTADVTTGNYTAGWWIGPTTGGAGCGANRINLGRDEEDGVGIVFQGCNTNTISGRQSQFNNGYGLELLSANENIWVGGLMEGNGAANASAADQAQVAVGGTSTDLTLSSINWDLNNFSHGGSSKYLVETLAGYTGDYIALEGGQIRNGFGTATLSAVGGTPTHYKQIGAGIPFIDTTGGSSIIANGTKFTTTGCSVSATTGGATAGTYTSGTTGTCTVVITMSGAIGMTAPTGWNCSANDLTTPADVQHQTASSATTATMSGTTVSGDVVSFSCMGY